MSKENHLKPANRYITIIPHFSEKKTDSGVYLPEEFVVVSDKYIEATVLDASAACASDVISLLEGEAQRRVVVDASMIETITIQDKPYYVVLENYVIGALR